ncbi:MAG: hypothetical protein JXR76_04100 [Deltaproteobacteria bacterium]|nr:hypothetical protein [Deltaproteobacteria bacterium]
MKNVKELWMQYQLEKELQLVPVEVTDRNEERIKELRKLLIGQLMPANGLFPSDRIRELKA